MYTQTKETQSKHTPDSVLQRLTEGNKRFVENQKTNRNLIEQVSETGDGQFPLAVVLGCIDSRVPAELVFDQGIGDIFNVRVAGNIVNEDILGSIEYGCKVAGSKLVVVLGHTKCGAVTSACKGVELGNITPLLSKIQPAVSAISNGNAEFDQKAIEAVSEENVRQSIARIKAESPILKEMDENNEIKIVGAIYNVGTGAVELI